MNVTQANSYLNSITGIPGSTYMSPLAPSGLGSGSLLGMGSPDSYSGMGGLGGGGDIQGLMGMLLQMMQMIMSMLTMFLGSMMGGSGGGNTPSPPPSSGSGGGGNTPSPPPSSNSGGGGNTPSPAPTSNSGGGANTPSPAPTSNSGGGANTPSPAPASDSGGGNTPSPTPTSNSGGGNTPSPAPTSNSGGGNTPSPAPTSNSGSDTTGAGQNVAGQGPVDPNKPIYIPMVNGKYDPKALDALAQQGLGGIDPTTAAADSGKGGDPGKSIQASWTISNGPLAGIKNGVAIAWGCYKNGFTSNDDLLNAAAVASIESTNSKNNGQSNGSGYTQNPSDNFAPNTGGAEGLFQLDPHWHSTQNAFNPFVNSIRAISLMKSMGKGATIAEDAPCYNTGNPGTTYAQAQGGYTSIPGIVADNDNSLRSRS